MLRNYLTIAFRNFWKYKGFTAINVVGLTLGIVCSILILLWVQDEWTTDRFHRQGDQIYRMMFNIKYPDGSISTWSTGPYRLMEVLETNYPGVEQITLTSWSHSPLFSLDENTFKESGLYVTPDFFKVFTFPFIQGDTDKALDDINAVVISESLAAKLFGDTWRKQNVVGKTVQITHDKPENIVISGVFEDPPRNSTMQFDFVLPMELQLKRNPSANHWS